MEEIYIREIKAKARQALSGKLGVAICALLILRIVSSLGDWLDRYYRYMYVKENHVLYLNDSELTMESIKAYFREALEILKSYETPGWVSLVSVICFLVSMPLIVGCARFFIGLTRGEEVRLSVIVEPYKNSPQIVALNIYTSILVLLQLFLFVIPGIIAAYRYALANYIVAEDEDISFTEAVTMSKEMMYGYKFKLFLMQLSFIGWFILSLFTCGILTVVFVGPYYNVAMAEFYNEVKAQTIDKQAVAVDDTDNKWGDGGNLY